MSFEGSQHSYGHMIIDRADVKRAENISDKEKDDNDEYSVDSVIEKLEEAGIETYDSEYYAFDFGI